MITKAVKLLEEGGQIDFDQALDLIENSDLEELCQGADRLRRFFHGDYFDNCSIINARSGNCSEDCRFCAQSARYQTEIEQYEIIPVDEALKQAVDNDNHKVKRLSLVTAGRTVTTEQLERFGDMYRLIDEQTDFLFCASMGLLTPEKADMLKKFGIIRYHCNLESCEEFFQEVCTTHSYQDKVKTIQIARDAGMDICSGGIIGIGESVEQRLQLAFELRDLEVLSIPINILTPIEKTPFGQYRPLSVEEVLRCIALFRFINPRAVVRLAGGRNLLKDQQYDCFCSGANGAIVGNYLTTSGNSLTEDLQRISKLGYTFSHSKHSS